MSGEEFLDLCRDGMGAVGDAEGQESSPSVPQKYVYGIQGLANLLGCSVPTASRIKKSGVLDGAITQVKRTIVIDAEKALRLLRASQDGRPVPRD